MEETEKPNQSFMLRLSAAIVDKRNLVFLIVLIGLVFSVVSGNWVQVENELAKYLPPESETRQGLDLMEEQFTTFGTAISRIRNNGLTLYYSGGTVTDESGAAVAGAGDEPAR